jgi:pyroglutamyl-peptidase
MLILVTGFEPFGDEKINPAQQVIKQLGCNISGIEVVKLEVPTVFTKSVELVIKAIEELKPDFVLCLGQAGGISDISVERVAINLDCARIPDSENQQPIDVPIDPEGQNAYFATIPVNAIVQAIKTAKVPARISYTAGTYVCNHIMYGVLNHIYKNKLNIKAGFIHLPYLTEQVVNKANMPSMSIETLVNAIEAAITAIAENDKDIKASNGYLY